MTGLPLQANQISFRTMEYVPEAIDATTAAPLFVRNLRMRQKALQHMLSWARARVTADILAKLQDQYPNNKTLEKLAATDKDGQNSMLRDGHLPPVLEESVNHELLQDMVAAISKCPTFDLRD